MTWTMCKDEDPTEPVEPFQSHGIVDLPFSAFDIVKLDVDDDAEYQYPF